MKRIILNGAKHRFALFIFCSLLNFLFTFQALYSQSSTNFLGFKPKKGYTIALFPKTWDNGINSSQYYTLTRMNYITFEGASITLDKVNYVLVHIPDSQKNFYDNSQNSSKSNKNPEWIGDIGPVQYGNYFWMKSDDKAFLEEYSLKTVFDFNVGLLYVPFKYRYGYSLNEQNVEGPFNLGTALNLRIAPFRTAQEVEIIVGFFQSFSMMNMDSTNNSRFEGSDKKGSIGGFSLGPLLGLRYKGASVAFASGWDFASGNLGHSWKFQRKAWWGLTVGYTLPDFIDKSKALIKQ